MAKALNLLLQDHNKVKEILHKMLEKNNIHNTEQQQELFTQLVEELELHEEIEEKLFYPPLKAHSATKNLILQAYEEHHLVDTILQELEELEPKDERWQVKLRVLQECFLHHVNEEEQEIFPQAEEVLKQDELETIAVNIEAMKQEQEELEQELEQ